MIVQVKRVEKVNAEIVKEVKKALTQWKDAGELALTIEHKTGELDGILFRAAAPRTVRSILTLELTRTAKPAPKRKRA